MNDDNYMDYFIGFKGKWIDEKDVIEIIINWRSPKDESEVISHFLNVLRDPVSHDSFNEYTGFYIATNQNRKLFQLTRQGKPGDFDIVIIPFSENKIFYERTAILEVKIVRPTKQNPNKNANSLGETQVYGLIEDGFPIIGVLHICMAEPLLEEEGLNMPFSKIPANSELEEHKRPLTSDDFVIKKIDTFSVTTADNQMKRLISLGFPKYVGIESVGLNVLNGGYIMMQSFNYNGFKSAYFNPQIKSETINKIQEHHTKYLKTNYKKVIFTH